LTENHVGRLPEVASESVTGDEVMLTFDLEPDQLWFEGHFPEQPVLAGVLQTHWAVSFAAQYGFLSDGIPSFPRIKFKSVILPPVELRLRLWRTDRGVRFSFSSESGLHSEGTVVVTGADG